MIDMRNHNHHRRRRPASEAGFVLPTVVVVVLIVTLLAGTAITVAMQSSTSTTTDNNVKAALAAAESGLQVATYRINQLKPKETQCITSSESKEGPTCEGSSEPLGNGASFKYWTTKALSAGEKCAGETIVSKSGIVQRCITSQGNVTGLESSTRLQIRIESAVGESLFSVRGILGLEEVLVNGSVKATAVVTSNLKIKGEGSAAFEKGFEICPEGKFIPAAGTERNKSGVTIGGVGGMLSNPPLEKTRSASECPIVANMPAVHPTAAENEDVRITTGEDPSTKEGWNNPEWTGASLYELTLGSGAELTMKGSKYYFCNFVAKNDGKLKMAAGVKTEIFIDSHENNSNCRIGTSKTPSGTFRIEGNAHLENPNGAAALLIEVAGKGPVTIANSGSLKASIYAPEAEVILSGSGTLTGAIVGKKVHLEAGSFIFSEEDEALTVGGAGNGAYSRKAWEQCAAGSGATAGC
jgi:type II secretory pathway pseudopilin PulG